MAQNAADGGTRRFVLVQLPEPLSLDNPAQRDAVEFCDRLGRPRMVTELTKERLRRAGVKIRDENSLSAGDTGFRVFRLDSTNIQAWDPDREDLEQTIEGAVDHLKADRTEQDILAELLLKLGLDLCVPIQARKIANKEVDAVGGGALLVCLTPAIAREDVETLARGIAAWHEELAPAGDATCVFRDSAFADDVAKTNLTAILEQHGLRRVRSL
jgi:adenine-specific DNA-methyltransferase